MTYDSSLILEVLIQVWCREISADEGLEEIEDLLTSKPKEVKPYLWRGLTDLQWTNIVNKNQAWFGYEADEVAHQVCKLTEEKLKEMNSLRGEINAN